MNKTKYLLLSALGAALIAVGALIKVPLPLVPMTLQLLMVLLCGQLLGPKWGGLAVGLYILMGLIGLPVFANGGGIGYLMKPTFGYLLGFILAAVVVGYLSRKLTNNWLIIMGINVIGTMMIYLIGLPYLYLIGNHVLGLNLNFIKILYSAFLIFIPTDIISCAIAAIIARRLIKYRQ